MSAIGDAVRLAWLSGFRAHREGLECRHGYGAGDHHWESGDCLAQTSDDIPALRCLIEGSVTIAHADLTGGESA